MDQFFKIIFSQLFMYFSQLFILHVGASSVFQRVQFVLALNPYRTKLFLVT